MKFKKGDILKYSCGRNEEIIEYRIVLESSDTDYQYKILYLEDECIEWVHGKFCDEAYKLISKGK